MIITWKNLEHKWRKQLLSYAHGNVLEVSTGTGENFKHYPLPVRVTATDTSKRLINVAKAEAMKYGINAEFVLSPVDELNFAAHRFDTIVSTFSISEYENPVWILEKLSGWCKPGGSLLILERGLSNYRAVRLIQQKRDSRFHKTSGSHINRDVKAIIHDAGLNIKKMERKMAGVIYMVWASPVMQRSKEIERIKL